MMHFMYFEDGICREECKTVQTIYFESFSGTYI
jgi:hypothetical protein